LKVVVLFGLQHGCTKFCRFLCECASRAKSSHYKKRDWPYLQSLEPGKQDVQHLPLEESSTFLLSPLNIELGLMQNSVRALDQTGPTFRHRAGKFPGIRVAKIKEGVFIGPQIRQLFRDEQFDRILSGNEKRAWNDFRFVATNFLANNKAEGCGKLAVVISEIGLQYVSEDAFSAFSHGFFFPENWGCRARNAAKGFIVMSLEWRRDAGKVAFIDVGRLLLGGNKRDSPRLVYKRKMKRGRN